MLSNILLIISIWCLLSAVMRLIAYTFTGLYRNGWVKIAKVLLIVNVWTIVEFIPRTLWRFITCSLNDKTQEEIDIEYKRILKKVKAEKKGGLK